MEILPLGHSSFLIGLPGARERPARILVDPWISDYAVGDLMARFPRVRFDAAALAPIDAIYLSHSHTDHLDPESLLALRAGLDPFPALLLPASLAHLVPLLADRLGEPEIHLLAEDEPIELAGITLSGFFNPEPTASNEDDVMVLVAAGDGEVLVSESDAVLPYDDPATRERLAAILGGPSVRTAALLTTKNQLEATMSMLAARDRTDRRERVARSLDLTCEEIFTIYGPTADDPDDLFANPRLVRLLGGQGLAAPARADLNRVLFPLRVADRVRLEREIAAQTGCAHRIGELVPGRVLRVEDGEVRDAGPAPSIAVLDREEDRKFAPDLERFADFPLAPLRDEARDRDAQERRILDYVERRFLPHLVGARNPPVERLLAEGGGEWRIRIRYGTRASHEDRDLVLTFARPRFEPAPAAGPPGEHLFANDVEDVLDGRADEFSTFCRAPLPAPTQHLWLSLGLPWLNPDLVERKLRFHFDRVARGETNEDFVTPFWRWS